MVEPTGSKGGQSPRRLQYGHYSTARWLITVLDPTKEQKGMTTTLGSTSCRGSYVVSFVLGWMKDDGSFGWLIIMAIPAAMGSSVITTFIGAVMLLVARIIQWGVGIARFR